MAKAFTSAVFSVLILVFAAAVVASPLIAQEQPAPAAQPASPAPPAASPGDGIAHEWQMGFQQPATPIMHQIYDFHTFVTIIIVAVALFVLGLLVFVMLRFNERAHPVPSRTTHHTLLEVAWTIIPVLILVVIAIPSFRLLFAQYDFPKADLTIKATGSQWYWSYEYPDQQGLTFDSLLVEQESLQPGQPRLLTVDNEVVVPVNKNVLVQVAANDVIHDWAMPAFGIKIDAVPGRLMTTWFRAERTGTFHGQCSELCGQRHAFMPIVVKVVTEDEFGKWVQEKQAANAPPPAPPPAAQPAPAAAPAAAAPAPAPEAQPAPPAPSEGQAPAPAPQAEQAPAPPAPEAPPAQPPAPAQ